MSNKQIYQMEKRIICSVVLAAAMVAAVPTVRAQKGGTPERDPIPMPTVSIDSVMKHIVELSSETYEGRLAGTEGYDRAAKYVGNVLRRYGVRELKEQPFELECNEVENCKFNIYTPGSKEKRVFTLGNEFCCAGMTGRGYVDAQMVFCGYGVDNGLFDEYKGVDVQGKIAVVLTGVPEWLPGSVADHYRTLRDKARTAERHGAIGLLAINISPSCTSYEPQGRVYCGELPHLGTFPILQLTLDCGREILDGEAMGLDAAKEAIDKEQKVSSFATLKKAEVDVNARYRPRARTMNVVGLLEGSDKQLRSEIVVVGASLDGIGIQGETCLFPGADINASGVAAVLETARVLSDKEFRPRRSVLFVLFSGSEQQYAGSREFLNQYGRLRNVEAFVNAQNIGCGDSLVVLGDNRYPTLWEIAHSHDTAADRQHMLRSEEKTNPRGDAKAFDNLAIPSIVVTTHNGMQHNHVASDIWENIDRRILHQATRLMAETVAELGEGLYQGRSPQSRSLRFRN